MNIVGFLMKRLSGAPPWLLRFMERLMTNIPFLREKIQRENEDTIAELERKFKPYQEGYLAFSSLPEAGLPHAKILQEMESLAACEEARWKDGYASGAVYHGEQEHVEFLNRVYAIQSVSNPLHADLWPSAIKYEAEVVAMATEMLGGEPGSAGQEIRGTISSGGTESILLAMKTYRDWARDRKKIKFPEVIAPVTAHAAFDKAAEYFGLRLVKIPVDADYRADVQAARKALNRRTIAIVGSAPSFPHGAIDPIPELSEVAREHGIGFHTDACLGGFILPWAQELGYKAPIFDFRLPGVTSISVDTHKYGYASKGTSVVLYRGRELRKHQYYATGDWPGGLYVTPSFAGSRPGALSAACWAAMVSLGKQGYREAARRVLETGAWIKAEIGKIPELTILGDPLWVIAFTSKELNIYKIMDLMSEKNWSLNGLFSPPAVHICVTLLHTRPGVAERFIEDLRSSVETVKNSPRYHGDMAPIYGMASGLPLHGLVEDMLKQYMDMLYKA